MMRSPDKDNTLNKMNQIKQNLCLIDSQFNSYDEQSAYESPSKRTRVDDVYKSTDMRPRLVAEPGEKKVICSCYVSKSAAQRLTVIGFFTWYQKLQC